MRCPDIMILVDWAYKFESVTYWRMWTKGWERRGKEGRWVGNRGGDGWLKVGKKGNRGWEIYRSPGKRDGLSGWLSLSFVPPWVSHLTVSLLLQSRPFFRHTVRRSSLSFLFFPGLFSFIRTHCSALPSLSPAAFGEVTVSVWVSGHTVGTLGMRIADWLIRMPSLSLEACG